MAYLIDTSILARLANKADAFYPVAAHAVLELHRRGEVLHVTPQNLVEFRNVATRPVASNGLGLAPPEADGVARPESSMGVRIVRGITRPALGKASGTCHPARLAVNVHREIPVLQV